MRNAVAFANNDVITIAWSYGKRPDGCMGFELSRIDAKGAETVLPSHAVFAGETIAAGQTTAQFPIQKFYWKDVYARPVAEKTNSFAFRYKVTPLEGKPGSLTPMKSLPILTTNEVELTSRCSPSLSATFNRGLISTQHVANALKGKLGTDSFKTIIGTKGNQLRMDLSGQMIATLTDFLKRAATSGSIYASLYELTDVELVEALVQTGTKLNIVLADIVAKTKNSDSGEAEGADETASAASKKTTSKAPSKTPKANVKAAPKTAPKTAAKSASLKAAAHVAAKRTAAPKAEGDAEPAEENKAAHDKIVTSSHTQLLYRRPPGDHIVHNKFLIYVDGKNKPQAVLTGSTNWTATGLCAQTNNAIVIEDPAVAQRYMDYWNALKTDCTASQQDPKSFQAAALRTFNGTSKQLTLDAKVAKGDTTTPSTLTSYFSPNTAKERSSNKAGEAFPIDMKDLSDRVMAAKHAILFLAFIPGTPSITTFAGNAQKANKDLFVRGCVTSPDAAGNFEYTLQGTSPPKTQPVKGAKKPPPAQDARVIAAEALDPKDVPDGWRPELLKAGFAITHDKIVVIDPFSDDCVVVTGSHNLGYKASFNNDENLVMIKGNRKLAMAYATHVLDVYDHFAWRWTVRRDAKPVDANLKPTPDDWLSWYYDDQGNIKTAQLNFWMQATI